MLATVTVSFFIAIDRLGVGPGVTIQFTGPDPGSGLAPIGAPSAGARLGLGGRRGGTDRRRDW